MALECILNEDSFWAIVYVVIGFLLGEGSRVARAKFRIRKLKRTIREELISIHKQIDLKKTLFAK